MNTDIINVSDFRNATTTTIVLHGRHQFISTYPISAAVCLAVLFMASIVGTFGNVMIITLVLTKKRLRGVETAFIMNLAVSDLYVTLIADPMSLIAKIEGEHFFDQVPGLCQAIASLCTISCVTSLMTIAMMSINRYFYICNHDMYERIFTRWNCICICICLYFIGGILVLLNALGIGDHSFDRKSLECIWDRMATFYYTVVFSITLVWIPSIITGACYLRIYLYVRKHKRRIQEQTQNAHASSSLRSSHLAKTLFIIYAVFITCWAPYALLIVLDSEDTYPHELHVYITMWAHLHPSLNWLIYYITNKHFADAYRQLLSSCCVCTRDPSVRSIPMAQLRPVDCSPKLCHEGTSNGDVIKVKSSRSILPTLQTNLNTNNGHGEPIGHMDRHLNIDETDV